MQRELRVQPVCSHWNTWKIQGQGQNSLRPTGSWWSCACMEICLRTPMCSSDPWGPDPGDLSAQLNGRRANIWGCREGLRECVFHFPTLFPRWLATSCLGIIGQLLSFCKLQLHWNKPCFDCPASCGTVPISVVRCCLHMSSFDACTVDCGITT